MARKINGHSPSSNLTFRLWLYTIWPNFIKIEWFVLELSCLRTKWHTHTHRDTHTHTQTDKSDHNTPSQNLWRGKKNWHIAISIVRSNRLIAPVEWFLGRVKVICLACIDHCYLCSKLKSMEYQMSVNRAWSQSE